VGVRRASLVAGFLIATKLLLNNAVSSGRSFMVSKLIKIVIDAILTFVFFIVMSIIVNSTAASIFGKKPNGDANFNGHVLLIITTVIAIVFAVWFYKYVSIKKNETK
jgi:hypothetical protein